VRFRSYFFITALFQEHGWSKLLLDAVQEIFAPWGTPRCRTAAKLVAFGIFLDSYPTAFHAPAFRDQSPTLMLKVILVLLTSRKVCH